MGSLGIIFFVHSKTILSPYYRSFIKMVQVVIGDKLKKENTELSSVVKVIKSNIEKKGF